MASRSPDTRECVCIIAACTDSKTQQIPMSLRLRGLREPRLHARMVAWRQHLATVSSTAVAAIDLYKGPHWAIIRTLPAAVPSHVRCELWVASAGYGLVPATALLKPYSATFASQQDDSVHRRGDGPRRSVLRQWWAGLSSIPRPSGVPSTIAELSAARHNAVLLVVGSPSYLEAMSDDFFAALSGGHDPEKLIIVSGRDSSHPDWLKASVVPSEAPLTSILGGSLGSLHARVARHLLQHHGTYPLRASALRTRYEDLVKEHTPARRAAVRNRVTDVDLRNFIADALSSRPRLSPTAALRSFRRKGWACEQRRFCDTFRELSEAVAIA